MYYLNEITELEGLINKVRAERFELKNAEDLKIQKVFDFYFNFFQEFDIKVSGESAYFRIKDEEGLLKEVFNIYFYERYNTKATLQLSYYTTSSQSDFELERLILLGRTAKIVRDKSEDILNTIAEIKNSNTERLDQLFSIQNGYEKQIRVYQKGNDDRRKVEIELQLRGEGVVFNKDIYIKLKSNYTARVNNIKLVDVSKSGKTGTAIFQLEHYNNVSREENINVDSIISQVIAASNNIVQHTLAE